MVVRVTPAERMASKVAKAQALLASFPTTVSAVAAAKGCAPRTVRRACESGALKATRAGPRLWLIDQKAAAKWTPQAKVGRPAAPPKRPLVRRGLPGSST